MQGGLEEKIRELCLRNNLKDQIEVNLIIRAIKEKNDELIVDIFVPKKWKASDDELFTFNFSPPVIPKSQSMLYFRYPIVPNPNVPKPTAVKAIIMGPCGIGKTCLVNNLCGTSLETGETESSLTRNVTEIQCQFNYDVPFIFYDTPGTSAHKDKLQHAIHLKQLLQFKPINAVLILVRYAKRADDIVNEFFRQAKMLNGFEKNVVFIVSHIDQAQDSSYCIKLVDKMMKELELENQVIFLSNKNIKKQQLANNLFVICRSLEQKQIKIDEYIFHKYFNLKKEQTEAIYFKKYQEEVIKEMENITEAYIKYANSLPQDNERDAIFQDLEVILKDELITLLENFQQKYKETMVANEFYSSYYTLQLKINQQMKQIQQNTKSFQNHTSIESSATGNKVDIRNLLKKCPNPACGLIWFRVERCPSTKCGARPNCMFDFIKSNFYRYKIVRDKKTNTLTLEGKNEMINSQKDNLNAKNTSASQRQKLKGLGCQQDMNFDTLPVLSNIEEILMDWYGVHSMEEVIARFNADKQIQKTRRQLEQKVNKSFYGFSW